MKVLATTVNLNRNNSMANSKSNQKANPAFGIVFEPSKHLQRHFEFITKKPFGEYQALLRQWGCDYPTKELKRQYREAKRSAKKWIKELYKWNSDPANHINPLKPNEQEASAHFNSALPSDQLISFFHGKNSYFELDKAEDEPIREVLGRAQDKIRIDRIKNEKLLSSLTEGLKDLDERHPVDQIQILEKVLKDSSLFKDSLFQNPRIVGDQDSKYLASLKRSANYALDVANAF